jgi:hypothetical protein
MYDFTLEAVDHEEDLAILRALFTKPEKLRPAGTPATVTEDAAKRIGQLALSLQARGVDPHRVAHFLMQILVCLFAEDVALLPNRVFSHLLAFSAHHPERFPALVSELFHTP